MNEGSKVQTDIDYEEKSFSLSDYYQMWQRRKWWAIGAFIASIIVSFVLCFVLPKVYMASTTILVTTQVIPQDYFKNTITLSSEKYLNVLTQEIMSASRLQKAIKQFGLFREQLEKIPMEVILEKMRKNIQIDSQKSSGSSSRGQGEISYFSISYSDADPETAKNVANFLAESFIKDTLDLRQKQARETLQFLSKELAKAQAVLEEKEKTIADFKEKYIGLLPEQQNINMQMLAQLLQQKERIYSEIKDAENRRIILQQQLNQLVTVGMLTNTPQMNGSAAVDPSLQELALAKRQYLEKRSYMTEEHPEMIALKKKISKLEQQPEAALLSDSNQPEKQVRAGNPGKSSLSYDIELQLTSVNRKVDEMKTELKKIDDQIALYQVRIDKSPKVDQELSVIMHDYDNAKESYNNLRKKQIDADQANVLEKEKQQEYFKVLDPAMAPEKPVFPDKRKVLLIGLLMGLGLATGLMVVMEFLDKSFHTVKDVEDYLNVNVIASISDQNFDENEPPKARAFS
jgi:polysaccharide chain length determinant protein (PEP-CTERM system associated)